MNACCRQSKLSQAISRNQLARVVDKLVTRDLSVVSMADARPNGWKLEGSRESKDTINPIRMCTETHYVDAVKQTKKDLYKLAIGDPSIFGNLTPHPSVIDAVKKSLESGATTGYGISSGYEIARKAIAEKFSIENHPVSESDVVMTAGCSGALNISFIVLCEPGQNIMVPSPCFTIYQTLAAARGINLKHYKLLADRKWEADLDDLDKQIDSDTRGILINNPSNPCGSVYSREHISQLLSVAEKHKLPIIADETYAEVVFEGEEFHSVASLSHNVPVLTCGGLSKRYLVPGWRTGWVIAHDRNGLLEDEIKPGLRRMATKNQGPCAAVQAAIPDIFKNVPESFFRQTIAVFEGNAHACYDRLNGTPGLNPIMPSGAMYMMVELNLKSFPEFVDDISFLKQMIIEQGVMCLPGTAFQCPDSFRIALIMPQDKLTIACDRIVEFCGDHFSRLKP